MFKKIKYLILNFVCQKNYNKKIKQIKNYPTEKRIRVLFYVTENSKWGYQSLYDELEKDDNFEPLVVVSLLTGVHKGKDKTRNNLEENYKFFKSRGMNVEYAYKNSKYLDLRIFHPDIVFYEQPWGLPNKYKPHNVSRYALTCYCPYGYSMMQEVQGYKQNFHKFIYRFFVNAELTVKRYETFKKGNSKNCVAIGYLKFDEYLNNNMIDTQKIWKISDKFKIIYAPHHSFEENSLKLATFQYNGKFILSMAKKHPETTWIFKPHPQFKFAVLSNKIMTEQELDNYYKEWEEIGKIYTQGDYIDIFKSSDLMITDCYSFLGEYLPTMKPLIRLINDKSIKLDLLGEKIVEGYYNVNNNEELEKSFIDLADNKNDYKIQQRQAFIPNIIDFNESCAKKILKNLKMICNK